MSIQPLNKTCSIFALRDDESAEHGVPRLDGPRAPKARLHEQGGDLFGAARAALPHREKVEAEVGVPAGLRPLGPGHRLGDEHPPAGGEGGVHAAEDREGREVVVVPMLLTRAAPNPGILRVRKSPTWYASFWASSS